MRFGVEASAKCLGGIWEAVVGSYSCSMSPVERLHRLQVVAIIRVFRP